jgi:hypothetical protein
VFWKARVEKESSTANKLLKSINFKQVDGRCVVRFNFADNSFEDIDYHRMPRFDLGEILTVEVYEDIILDE